MWLMTPFGFFSIVCAHAGAPGLPNTDKRMIRARCRKHLEALRRYAPGLPAITETGNTDYPYRIITTKNEATALLMALGESIDYTNFKSEAKRVDPGDHAYHGFLGTVWGAGLALQPAGKGIYGHRATGTRGKRGDLVSPLFEDFKQPAPKWVRNPAWQEGDPTDEKFIPG